MESAGPSLPQRVTAVVNAKQYLVFFAVALYSLQTVVPLGSAWLYRHGPVADLLGHDWGPLADALAARSAVIGLLFVFYLVFLTWLRAGYIRSLVGRFHLRPRDGRQFASLLAFEFLLEVVGALAAGGVMLAGDSGAALNGLLVCLLFVNLALLYADYVIVISDTGPLRAIALSWRTVRANLPLSVLVVFVVATVQVLAAGLLNERVTGSLAAAAPMILLRCVLMGVVVFVTDVVLVVVYATSLESGRVKPGPGRQAPGAG